MKATTATQYDKRMSRVCEYIAHNLDQDLSLIQLSHVAALSKYHFHRVFSGYMGVSLNEYIQLARLKRASFRLAFEPQKNILDIALEAGFEHAETFTRAFKRYFEQTPSDFRASPNWQQWHDRFTFTRQYYREKAISSMKVKCVDFPVTKVALLRHIGSPEQVLETAGKFIAWRKATGLSPIATSKTFGIPHSDPNLTDPSDFCWDVCGSINQDIPENNFGVVNSEIPGGRCALVQHKGSHDQLDSKIYYIYEQWLTEHNEEVRNFPCYFHYHNFIHEVDECDLVTDIYVPLK